MGLDHDIESLGGVQLFEGFSQSQLRLLAFGSSRKFMRPNEVIFRQNDLSEGGFVILSGQVDLVVYKGKREMLLASYMKNSLVGEIALISDNRRVATAVSRTDANLMLIPRDLFRRMLSEYPELAILLHQRIGNSVKKILEQMEQVQIKLGSIPNLSQAPASVLTGSRPDKTD